MKNCLLSVCRTPQHSSIQRFCVLASIRCCFDRDEDISSTPTSCKHTLLISSTFQACSDHYLIVTYISIGFNHLQDGPSSLFRRSLRPARQSPTARAYITTQDSGLRLFWNALAASIKMVGRHLYQTKPRTSPHPSSSIEIERSAQAPSSV